MLEEREDDSPLLDCVSLVTNKVENQFFYRTCYWMQVTMLRSSCILILDFVWTLEQLFNTEI